MVVDAGQSIFLQKSFIALLLIGFIVDLELSPRA